MSQKRYQIYSVDRTFKIAADELRSKEKHKK